METKEVWKIWDDARYSVIQAIHDYLVEQPGKAVENERSCVLYDDKLYKYINIPEDPSVEFFNDGHNFNVGYEQDGFPYAESIEVFSMDEIYNIMMTLL